MKRLLLCAALVASASTTTFAASFIVPSDRELVRRADAIVVATALRSFTQSSHETGIETVTSLQVSETIRGSVPGLMEIHEPGGELGGRVEIIPGVPRFNDGDQALLFLRRTPNDTWAVADIALGHFSFAEDRLGQRLLVRAEEDVVGW